MLLPIAFVVQVEARVSAVPASLEALARARSEFETRLGEREPTVACMFMGAGNEALFPFGVADRRVLIERIGGYAPRMIYQRRNGRTARTDWAIRLDDRKGARPRYGTLRRLLWDEGYGVGRRSLTSEQRAVLNVEKPFAMYTVYSPDQILQVGSIRADGTEAEWDIYFSFPWPKGRSTTEFRPIVAEEARALGLGRERWHGPGPLRISHVAKLADMADTKIISIP